MRNAISRGRVSGAGAIAVATLLAAFCASAFASPDMVLGRAAGQVHLGSGIGPVSITMIRKQVDRSLGKPQSVDFFKQSGDTFYVADYRDDQLAVLYYAKPKRARRFDPVLNVTTSSSRYGGTVHAGAEYPSGKCLSADGQNPDGEAPGGGPRRALFCSIDTDHAFVILTMDQSFTTRASQAIQDVQVWDPLAGYGAWLGLIEEARENAGCDPKDTECNVFIS